MFGSLLTGLASGALSALGRVAVAACSEKVMTKAIMLGAKGLAKKTSTTYDDELLPLVEEALAKNK